MSFCLLYTDPESLTEAGEPKMDDSRKGTAIVALTTQGAKLAGAVASHLGEAEVFLPQRLAGRVLENAQGFRPPLSSLIPRLFHEYRHLVFFCALGAVVRLVAPQLKGKAEDPAVVVVDERGWNVISVLSGHLGGANRLARELADLLGARPVITTATDLHGIPALDELCRERGWRMENPEVLAALTSALLDGKEVYLLADGSLGLERNVGRKSPRFLLRPLVELREIPEDRWKVVITDRSLPKSWPLPKTLIIRSRRLVAGLGLHRQVPSSYLKHCLIEALASAGLSVHGVGAIATIDRRRGETGLEELASELGAELHFLSARELEETPSPSPPSESARRWMGVSGVCEKAALAASGGGKLLVPKTRFPGVTVAVAERSSLSPSKKGRLTLVGTGPGDPELIPPKARRAILLSDAVIGYSGYLGHIADLLSSVPTIAFGMGSEVERLREALDLAKKGMWICVVSGGDPGIYGMTAVLGDLLLSGRVDLEGVEVEVIPGIPAHCAASSLLGSPLACDFAVISLSDYLVKADRIKARLEACAASDLVIALYNPASSCRRELFREAADTIARHRAPSTPVALVRNAWREGQSVRIIPLSELRESEVDMNTLVIVGNSETHVTGKWMATRRGYGKSKGL